MTILDSNVSISAYVSPSKIPPPSYFPVTCGQSTATSSILPLIKIRKPTSRPLLDILRQRACEVDSCSLNTYFLVGLFAAFLGLLITFSFCGDDVALPTVLLGEASTPPW
jgi:hypothetical protein